MDELNFLNFIQQLNLPKLIIKWPFPTLCNPFLGKKPNYKIDEDYVESDEPDESSESSLTENSESDFQESDEESGELDEESGREDEEGCRSEEENGQETEAISRDGREEQDGDQVGDNEMPTKRVKTEHLVPDEEVYAFDDSIGDQKKIESEQDCQSENDKSDLLNLTPIRIERTAFDCYDFNDLIKKNQSRMKEESVQKDEQSGAKDKESVKEKGNDGEDEVERGNGDQVGNELCTKRVKTERLVPDEEVGGLDDPVGGSHRTIKREHDLDSQTSNDEDMATTPYVSTRFRGLV